MDLNQLSVFVRVVDAGSFTKAAAFLRQPKSRVSRRIATLERDLGVALFYRTTRQSRPTDAGLALYRECRDHIYALEGASSSAKETAHEVTGTLKISAAEDMGTELLSPIIGEVLAKNPGLSIDARFSNGYVDLIRDGFDLAIRIGDLTDTSLKARRIGEVSSVLVASPAYLKKAPKITRVEDLADHATLDFNFEEEEDDIWTLKAGAKSKREERVRIRPRCRASNPRILVELALAGKGVALVPVFLCRAGLKSGALKAVLPEYCADAGSVSFVWPAQKETSPKIRAFVDAGLKHLRQYFGA